MSRCCSPESAWALVDRVADAALAALPGAIQHYLNALRSERLPGAEPL